MKTCSNCGAVCPENAVFCPDCGVVLSADAAPSTASSAPVQPTTSPNPTMSPVTPPISPYAQQSMQPTGAPSPYAQPPVQTNPVPSPYTPPAPPYAQQNGTPYGQTPVPGYPYQQHQKRNAPLVLGIVGIVFAILLPLVTYCCSIPGLVMVNQDVQRGLPNQSARVLNIIALCLAVANSIFGILWRLL